MPFLYLLAHMTKMTIMTCSFFLWATLQAPCSNPLYDLHEYQPVLHTVKCNTHLSNIRYISSLGKCSINVDWIAAQFIPG
ncbi:hypothetical protein M758_9G148200 [Ceratodon purpureus]|nr:hypothetical protein M758_9G148200 [Ceratodon purpureus]